MRFPQGNTTPSLDGRQARAIKKDRLAVTEKGCRGLPSNIKVGQSHFDILEEKQTKNARKPLILLAFGILVGLLYFTL